MYRTLAVSLLFPSCGKLNAASSAAMDSAEPTKRLLSIGINIRPGPRTSAYAATFVEHEIKKSGAPIKASGIVIAGAA